MDDDQETEPGTLAEELRAAEQRLQELVSVTSIDVLGSSTRTYLDKAMLVAAVGIVISLLGNPSNDISLGAVKITLRGAWVIPALAAVAVVFYGVGLALLARMDYRRWNALYVLKSMSLTSLVDSLRKRAIRDVEEFQAYTNDVRRRVDEGEFLDSEMSADGIPKEVEERGDEYRERADNITTLVQQISRPGAQVRRQARNQIVLFVAVPLLLSLIALGLCFWTAGRAYLTPSGSVTPEPAAAPAGPASPR